MAVTDGCFRLQKPGGTEITRRALSFCHFKKDAKLADIGCGHGETARFAKEYFDLDIVGADKDARLAADFAGRFIAADAAELPFADGTFDGLLFECSLSKMDEPEKVLKEAARLLVRGGRVILTDFYSRGEESTFSGALGRADSREKIESRLTGAGFNVLLFEDRSEDMKALWAQMLFEYGSEKLYETVGADADALRKAKCGYALFIAEKI